MCVNGLIFCVIAVRHHNFFYFFFHTTIVILHGAHMHTALNKLQNRSTSNIEFHIHKGLITSKGCFELEGLRQPRRLTKTFEAKRPGFLLLHWRILLVIIDYHWTSLNHFCSSTCVNFTLLCLATFPSLDSCVVHVTSMWPRTLVGMPAVLSSPGKSSTTWERHRSKVGGCSWAGYMWSPVCYI